MTPSDADPTSGLSRRDFLRIGGGGLGAIALGGVLAACGNNSTGSGGGGGGGGSGGGGGGKKFTGGPPAGGSPVKGGTLTVAVIGSGQSETIAVPTALNLPDIARTLNLYDLMFLQKDSGKVAGGLIEEGTPNADASVWNFRIRQGVTWHDGKSLTPEDIVYTIQHSWGDKKNIFNAVLAQIVDFANVKKVGPRDVRIPLKHGVALFPSVTCFNSCAVIQDGTTDFSKGIGTGPFKLVSFTAGKSSTFSANKNYWIEGQPYVDQMIIDSSYSSESARMNALLAGDADVLPAIPPSLARANAAGGRIYIGNRPGPGFVNMNMRTDSGPLKDPRVRRALKLIPGRQQYVDTVFSGYGTVGTDLAGYTNQFFATDVKDVQDIAQAKSLLKAAGADGLNITLDTAAAFPGMNESASLFAEQAKKAGVTVKLNQTDPSTYFTPAAGFFNRPFSMSFYNSGVNSLATFYLAACVQNGPYNEAHFGSAADDKLIYSALAETDDTKAADKWLAVQKRQLAAGGYIIPSNITWLDGYGLKVRGIQTTPAMNCDNHNYKSAWKTK